MCYSDPPSTQTRYREYLLSHYFARKLLKTILLLPDSWLFTNLTGVKYFSLKIVEVPRPAHHGRPSRPRSMIPTHGTNLEKITSKLQILKPHTRWKRVWSLYILGMLLFASLTKYLRWMHIFSLHVHHNYLNSGSCCH